MTNSSNDNGADMQGSISARGAQWYIKNLIHCCTGLRYEDVPSTRSSNEQATEPATAKVMLMASSDVMHAIRSPHVNVRFTCQPSPFIPRIYAYKSNRHHGFSGRPLRGIGSEPSALTFNSFPLVLGMHCVSVGRWLVACIAA